MNKAEKNRNPKMQAMIRRLLPYTTLSVITLFVIQFLSLWPPLIMQKVIDQYIPTGDIRMIAILSCAFIGIPILTGIGQAVYQYLTAIFSRKSAFSINRNVVENIIQKDMLFHRQNNSGELSAQATKDASAFINLWLLSIPATVSTLLVALITLAALFRMNAFLSVLQLVYLPLLLIPGKKIGKSVNKNAEIIFGTIAKILSFIQEVFRGVRTIKLNRMTGFVINRYETLFMSINRLFAKTAAAEMLIGNVMTGALSSLMTGLGFVIGAVFIVQGNFTVGALISYMALVPRLHTGINNLVGTNVNYMKQLGEYRQLFAFYEQTEDGKGAIPPHGFEDVIRFENICFSYTKEQSSILKNTSLEIKKGQWTAIEGASGAGKTTIINLLLALYRPELGHILLDGMDITDIDRNWYWNQFAVVDQAPFLLSGTIRENMLAMVPNATDKQMNQALDAVYLTAFLRTSPNGLDSYIGEDGMTISGGQKQRISLACALLGDKPILVLDEATSNLDPATESLICEHLKRRVSEGLTVITISHREKFHRYADRTYLISNNSVQNKPNR